MTCRFLYDNKITSEGMFDVSSLKTGIVSDAIKQGTGSAVMTPSGNFSGEEDIQFTVEIDSVAGGAEIGQATFRWTDGSGSYIGTGVLTSVSPTALNNGALVAFTAGTGADFVIGDTWIFKGINPFNPGKMIDDNRDSRYRSSALETPNTITIDFGVAVNIDSLVIFDHNFTTGVTLSIKANSADSWGSPAFSESITYNKDKIIHYLATSQNYRYWQFQITDAGNPDNYIEIGELFLGVYFEPILNLKIPTASRDEISLITRNTSNYGPEFRRFYNYQKIFRYDFDYIEDWDDFQTMFLFLGDSNTGIIKYLFFNEESTESDDFWMVGLELLPNRLVLNTRRSTSIEMKEVLKSV